jgi:excisionase family DNA binding protein
MIEQKQIPIVQPATIQAAFEPYIDKQEMARRLNKKLRTIDSWMKRGLLPYYKIGRCVSFKWSEVEKHLGQLCRVCHRDENN